MTDKDVYDYVLEKLMDGTFELEDGRAIWGKAVKKEQKEYNHKVHNDYFKRFDALEREQAEGLWDRAWDDALESYKAIPLVGALL
jgi:hypothetical protein